MDPFDFEKVTLQEAKAELDKRDGVGQHKNSWGDRRKPLDPDDLRLHKSTFKWIASLPVNVQPRQMARLYPRVANKLAKIWKHKTDCERELNDLLIDSRGDRQGFPLQVISEIMALKVHLGTDPQENTLDWSRSPDGRVR